MKIAIRMPNWLGDLVMATPMIEEVRKRWGAAHITAICKDPLASLLQGHFDLDVILPLSKATHIQADIGILLTNSFSSAWHFFKNKIKIRIGYKSDGRSLLLNNPIPFPKERGKEHLVDTYKRLLGVPNSPSRPQLFITQEESDAAKKKLRCYGIPDGALLIGVNPTAAYGPAKCWLPERFREITKRFSDCYFLYFGDRTGLPLVTQICQGMPASVINLAAQTTIREFMALIAECDVFLTNDSGPMHLAAALRTPLLALFGSTNEVATGPYHFGKIIHKHVSCSPCYKRVCPIDFHCMTQITVDEVEKELIFLLQKRSSQFEDQELLT